MGGAKQTPPVSRGLRLRPKLGEGGFVESLGAIVILITITIAFAGVQILIENQQKLAWAAKRKLEFKSLTERLTHILADPNNCERNLGAVQFGRDLSQRGLWAYKDGTKAYEMIKTGGQMGNIQIAGMALRREKVIDSQVWLVKLEIRGTAVGDTRQLAHQIPIYAEVMGSTVQKCQATFSAGSDSTVEERTCQALIDMGLESKFGSYTECMQTLADRVQLGEQAPVQLVTAVLPTSQRLPAGTR